MKHQPLVSIIMPCYNTERFISDTIESVRRQTYSHWELIIVDDASDDGTADIVNAFCVKEDRIRFFVKNEHTGIADSRNKCIEKAKGQYLAFIDSDDLWYSEKLEIQLGLMLEHNIGFSYSSYDCMDECGKSLNRTIKAAGNLSYSDYMRNTIIGCSTVMLNKAIIGEVEVPDFRTSEDTATWLNILKKGFFAYAIEKPLVCYRIRKHSASSNKLKASADLWRVYRKQEKISLFKASYCFCCYAFNAIKKHV